MTKWLSIALLSFWAVAAGLCPAFAVQPDEVLSDTALETRARAISADLRCLVCQNQSIDDSDAPLAKDLRVLVRERLTKGDSDEQVRAFLVARYGEFVLLKPPVSWNTILLWGAPLLILIGAVALVIRTVFARAANAPTAPSELSEDERKALDKLLRDAD